MSKLVSLLSLACLVLTALWVGALIADMASAGPLATFEQVAAHASRLHGLFYGTYLNAALLTLTAVAFFAALHAWFKPTAPRWALIGLVFVPIYGAFNLVVYLSQVTLVPALVALRLDPQYTQTADALLRLTLQAWPGSTIAFFNALAYGILGIPSILYGLLLRRRGGALRWGGLQGCQCLTIIVVRESPPLAAARWRWPILRTFPGRKTGNSSRKPGFAAANKIRICPHLICASNPLLVP